MNENHVGVDLIISLGQYTIAENQPYCKPHYLRFFKETGGLYIVFFSFKNNDNLYCKNRSVAVSSVIDRLPVTLKSLQGGSNGVRSNLIT